MKQITKELIKHIVVFALLIGSWWAIAFIKGDPDISQLITETIVYGFMFILIIFALKTKLIEEAKRLKFFQSMRDKYKNKKIIIKENNHNEGNSQDGVPPPEI